MICLLSGGAGNSAQRTHSVDGRQAVVAYSMLSCATAHCELCRPVHANAALLRDNCSPWPLQIIKQVVVAVGEDAHSSTILVAFQYHAEHYRPTLGAEQKMDRAEATIICNRYN